MKHLSSETKQPQRLDWRRSKVLELSSQGYSEREIGKILKLNDTAVHRDLVYLRKEAQQNLQKHIQETLPHEYQKCIIGINQVLKISWDIVHNDSTNNNNRLQALSLINDCNKYKMDLTTNGVVITDAIKFVQSSKEKLLNQSTTTSQKKEDDNNKESKEPDYNHDKDKDLEEEEQQEEIETEEMTNITNQTF